MFVVNVFIVDSCCLDYRLKTSLEAFDMSGEEKALDVAEERKEAWVKPTLNPGNAETKDEKKNKEQSEKSRRGLLICLGVTALAFLVLCLVGIQVLVGLSNK